MVQKQFSGGSTGLSTNAENNGAANPQNVISTKTSHLTEN